MADKFSVSVVKCGLIHVVNLCEPLQNMLCCKTFNFIKVWCGYDMPWKNMPGERYNHFVSIKRSPM